MHIPDGYLGPPTYIALFLIMIPIWIFASRKVERDLQTRQIPLLAFGAAFTFIIMMFNIPAPGGTTGHAVGGAILALTLGPSSAVLGVSAVLAIQALLFGDGGITAIGANCFNMAVVLPFVSYYCYKLFSFRAAPTSKRRWIAAAAAGYIGLNVAALATAVELGIQPLLHVATDGRPIYFPYSLSIAITAMGIEHLLIFGFVEAIATGFLVAYLIRSDPTLVTSIPKGYPASMPHVVSYTGSRRKLWLIVGVLVILTPLGLLASGTPFGEWALDELGEMVGFIPTGMKSLEGLWSAPIPDYSLNVEGPVAISAVYITSALIGVSIIGIVLYVWYRVRLREMPHNDS